MDDQRVGAALRAIRVRKRWRQKDLAAKAKVSRTMIGRIEHGRLTAVPLGSIRRAAHALDARLDTVVRWQGGDLWRLISARHSAMHEAVAELFGSLEGWVAEPEVSFSIFGERGIIDVLAWNDARRMLLVVELKTELVDINELMATMDRKRRLAAEVASDRSWEPIATSTWVVVAESRTNRRAVSAHETVLRAKFPVDGRRMRGWLRGPSGRVDALTFLPSVHEVRLGRDLGPVRRVTRSRPAER
ncbi:MAG: helix-turn-helix domain-containing protein [Candidatus Limnocylindrales bacterium]|nr:helix-turn-helix domain-containing protein [Candidatus Limnocylindrales bacterium]